MNSLEVRCFFALWPAPELAANLFELGAGIAGRRMRQETLHLTLAFLGNVPMQRIPRLCSLAGHVLLPALELTLDRVGYWPHKQICWVGPGRQPQAFSDFVATLHTDLRDAGFDLEDKAFAAHLTLLRNVRETPASGVLTPSLQWPLAGWRLVASLPDGSGRRYESLGEWSAGADHSV